MWIAMSFCFLMEWLGRDYILLYKYINPENNGINTTIHLRSNDIRFIDWFSYKVFNFIISN